MELLQLLLLAALGVFAVVFLIRRQQGVYGKHVEQLQPKKAKVKRFDVFEMDDVRAHNAKGDLWLVIKHKQSGEWRVFDVTDFIDDHPGGETALLKNGGGDATKGFYGPHHPDAVFVMMEEFCIGKLADGESP